MKKRTILMVAACPFPANYGSPAAIREMSDTLAEMGNEVHIVTYAFGDKDLPIKYAHLHRITAWGKQGITVGPTWQKPIYDLQLVFLACGIARKYKCELIHAHNYEGVLVGICTKILLRLPLLYNAVNLMSDELATYDFIKPKWVAHQLAALLDWFVPKIPDEILTISDELKAEMVAIKVPESKITVIPIGILPEIFDRADPTVFGPKLNPKGAPTVMYTGTIDAFQRVDYLFEAFARLDPTLSNALLMIVCPFTLPAQKKVLDDLARTLKIEDRVVWVESHSLEELPDYLAIADVAVAPRPHCAGYPVKLLNYMCASRPIVVVEGSAKGLRHLVNAYVSADHDIDGMAKGLNLLLQDKETAMRLAKAGRARLLEAFDWRELCRRIEVIYERILTRRGKASSAVQPT